MGLAIGGSHGLFTHPLKFIGHELSLKQMVPNLLSAAGATVGTLIAPGVGTAFGAGLGAYAGNELEGQTGKKSLSSAFSNASAAGLITGGLGLAGVNIAGAGAGAGAAGGMNAGSLAAHTGASAIDPALNSGGIISSLEGAGSNVASSIGKLVGSPASTLENAGSHIGSDLKGLYSAVGGAGSGGSAASAGGGLLSRIGGLASDIGLSKSDIIPALGMAYSAVKGNPAPAGLKNIQAQAALANQNALALENPLTHGTPLPGGLSAGIQQAADAAKAQIRQEFSSMGLSGSTEEATALAQVQQNQQIQTAQTAQSLFTQGAQQAGISTADYQLIMQTQLQQDQNLQAALASFATAMGGGGVANSGTSKAA
jgi:hypothetical protein